MGRAGRFEQIADNLHVKEVIVGEGELRRRYFVCRIRLRPMLHRLERRIEAHVKLCLLALLIQRVAERRAGEAWPRMRHVLASLQATEFRTERHRFFRRSEPLPKVRELLKKLSNSCPAKVLGARALQKDLLAA